MYSNPSDNKPMTSRQKLAGWLIILGIVGYASIRWYTGEYGTNEIGSFWEKRNGYEATYMINAYPAGSEAKNYRLKATISRQFQDGDCGEYEGYCSGTSTVDLMRMHFPNGGSVGFGDDGCDLWVSQPNLRPSVIATICKPASCRDEEERSWKIELVSKEAVQ